MARKLKYPDLVDAQWQEKYLGEDQHGQWAVLPAGNPVERSSGTVLRYRCDQVLCYSQYGWWVARFGCPDATFTAVRADGTRFDYPNAERDRIDISTPAEVSGRSISFIDLTLDILRDNFGNVKVVDADEVEMMMVKYAIPDSYVFRAGEECEELIIRLADGTPPFDDSPLKWHERYREGQQDEYKL